MKRSIARRWVKALDSGEYKQTEGKLRDGRDNFCCLGVLCNIHAYDHPEVAAAQLDSWEYLGSDTELPEEVMKWAGMQSMTGQIKGRSESLIDFNDCHGLTFPQIAKVIRKHWKDL